MISFEKQKQAKETKHNGDLFDVSNLKGKESNPESKNKVGGAGGSLYLNLVTQTV